MRRPVSLAPFAVLLAVAGCSSSSTPTTGTTAPVAVTAPPTPAPTPAPTPTPDPGPGPIAYIRVSFYGVECPHGRKAPNNGAKQVPVGCTAFVTATPKQADGTDVKPKDHGPDISWRLVQGEGLIKLEDDPEQPFNKHIKGKIVGFFSLCATVRGVEGCLDGMVI